MTHAEIKDLCLVKLHTYRSQLDSAFAGNSAFSYPQDVTAIRENLRFWESVATAIAQEGLDSEQMRRVLQEAVKPV